MFVNSIDTETGPVVRRLFSAYRMNDRSAVPADIHRIFPANSYRVAPAPKVQWLSRCILRNGHSRSLQ